MIYPNIHKEHPDATRSVMLINANLVPDTWKQIQIQHPDLTAIEITGEFGMLHIINVYNDCNNNSMLMHLSAYMQNQDQQRYMVCPLNTIRIGDFNQHHTLWDEEQNTHLFTPNNLELTQHKNDTTHIHANIKISQHREPQGR
jgi:hypothetical protein